MNLDLRDVHIDHPELQEWYPSCREKLADRPDTIYVPSDPDEGEVYNGELRYAANKRNRSTFIPIDPELKRVLLWYLNIRPSPRVCSKAFFVGTGGSSNHLNERLSTTTVFRHIRKHAEAEGWWVETYHSMNVNPHYFRHFFTTHARYRMDSMTVKYIRGDREGGSMEPYTHNWNDYVREEYLRNVFRLF